MALLLGCGKAATTTATTTPTTTTTTVAIAPTAAPVEKPVELPSPAAALAEVEREVWSLEGTLLAEAEVALRAPAAKTALGEPGKLRYSDESEARVRAYLRTSRSAAVRAKTKALVGNLNHVTRAMLDQVAKQSGLTPEDVFMDYLTYDALFDLAIMRYGYKRWKANAYKGAEKALADSFFSLTPAAPSADAGIKVIASDSTGVEINVFGGHVVSKVESTSIKERLGAGAVGVVELSSNYEQLRAAIRGAKETKHVEELEQDIAGYRVNYADELDEYLTWNATNPWAAVLYAAPANDVADMYAGAAAAGGFQATTVALDPNVKLPTTGVLGTKERGLTVTVKAVQKKQRLGAQNPRRGQFVVVTVEIASSLKDEVKAPAEWFRLATSTAEFPELGVSRPGLAVAVLPTAPAGAKLLEIPFTSLAKGAKSTLVLVYDAPSDLKTAALLVGMNELALDVTL
jgi:hypothetical protein